MLLSKKLMFALITAGTLAAPVAHAGYPNPYPKPDPKPAAHKCKDIKLKDVEIKAVQVKEKWMKGVALKVTGKVKGLQDGKDAEIEVEAKGEVEFMCKNQKGKGYNPFKGQKQEEFHVMGSDEIPKNKIEDGKAWFKVITDPIDAEISCKQKWSMPVIKEINVDKLHIVVDQHPCEVKFKCTVEDPVTGEAQDVHCVRVDNHS